MNRIVTTAVAGFLGGAALLTLGGCTGDIAGSSLAAAHSTLQGNPVSGADIFAGRSAGNAAPTAPTGRSVVSSDGPKVLSSAAKPTTGPGSGSGQGTGPTTGHQTGTSVDPTIQGPAQHSVPGSGQHQSTAPTISAPTIKSASISCEYAAADQSYHAFLSYEVGNATGMALSIDNPGIVGSYGTYDWHGTIEIPSNGCYASYGEQQYTLYTVGGSGKQASRTITRTGTYTVITPPPFSTPTTKAPIPTPTPQSTTPIPTPALMTTAQASATGSAAPAPGTTADETPAAQSVTSAPTTAPSTH